MQSHNFFNLLFLPQAKMPPPHSARSDGSDGEMEGLAETELVKLQRKFRIMENDRAAYTEESQNMIRSQKCGKYIVCFTF